VPALILDEVQRTKNLLIAIRLAVDADPVCRAGRFVVTGSGNVLMMESIGETLSDFRRSMPPACLRITRPLNQTELGRDVGSSQSQENRFRNVRKSSCQLVRLRRDPPRTVEVSLPSLDRQV
jgi:predicted AAA+ superfamily ATPase